MFWQRNNISSQISLIDADKIWVGENLCTSELSAIANLRILLQKVLANFYLL